MQLYDILAARERHVDGHNINSQTQCYNHEIKWPNKCLYNLKRIELEKISDVKYKYLCF